MVDTNVVLDQLLDNPGFAEHAEQVIAIMDNGLYEGFVCATAITNISYILRKHCGKGEASNHLKVILSIFKVAPVDAQVLLAALSGGFDDYEDAVVYESALASGAQLIVTRDSRGFEKSSIPVMSPEQFLALPPLPPQNGEI
jgi:predicted nucleic acid-binding protein